MRAHGPLICGLWLVLLATSACGGSGTRATETDPPVIVATTTIVGDLIVASGLGLEAGLAERYDCLVTLPDAAPAETPGPPSNGRDPARVALFIDSLGGPGSAAETYADMMLTNADRLAQAGPVAYVERAPTRP
jgi:ABC-type Zn uptake system ZnuABC Zn-binding protein ZnuA